LLCHGTLFGDAVIFAQAHRAASGGDDTALAEIAELAAALAGSKEQFLCRLPAWPVSMQPS
jgi:urease accessory protein